MSITKTAVATILGRVYQGNGAWEPKHFLRLVPGNDEEINCWLCNKEEATHLPHLELFQRDQVSPDGQTLCTECARMSEQGWQEALSRWLLLDLAKAIRSIPKAGDEHYAFNPDCLRGQLMISMEVAEIAMNGLEIEPAAAAFLIEKGGAA